MSLVCFFRVNTVNKISFWNFTIIRIYSQTKDNLGGQQTTTEMNYTEP